MELILLSIGLLILAVAGSVLAAWLFSDRKFKLLLVWIPLCLLAAASTYWTMEATAGWPKKSLPDSFAPIAYTTDGKKIYVWVVEKGQKVPRSFVEPYSKELHQQLENAKQSGQQGNPQRIDRKKGGKQQTENGNQSQGEWKSYNLRPAGELPPKQP